MPLVECPVEDCPAQVAVDVEPGRLRTVSLSPTVASLEATEATCENGHEFYVHH